MWPRKAKIMGIASFRSRHQKVREVHAAIREADAAYFQKFEDALKCDPVGNAVASAPAVSGAPDSPNYDRPGRPERPEPRPKSRALTAT
jgi:hypothetical protein